MLNKDYDEQQAQENEIGLGELLEEINSTSKKDEEEIKQEETLAEAQRDGHMDFLGDCGGSQCTIQQPRITLSQPVLR